MTKKSELGAKGEYFAAEYLKKKGFKIIERNARQAWGELDIIALAPDKTLVFVEVKTMSGFNPSGLRPENHMTEGKMSRFKKTAESYANRNPKLINDRRGWRLDVIALSKVGNDFVLKHYDNV